MEYWRRCCAVIRTDRIPNNEISERMGVTTDAVRDIEEKILKWYGHIGICRDDRWITVESKGEEKREEGMLKR